MSKCCLSMGGWTVVALLAVMGCGRSLPSTPSHLPAALATAPLVLGSQLSTGGKGMSSWFANYPDTSFETMKPTLEEALQSEGYRVRVKDNSLMAEKEVGERGENFVRVSLFRGSLRTEVMSGRRVVRPPTGTSGCAVQYSEFYGSKSPFKDLGPAKKIPKDVRPPKGLNE